MLPVMYYLDHSCSQCFSHTDIRQRNIHPFCSSNTSKFNSCVFVNTIMASGTEIQMDDLDRELLIIDNSGEDELCVTPMHCIHWRLVAAASS